MRTAASTNQTPTMDGISDLGSPPSPSQGPSPDQSPEVPGRSPAVKEKQPKVKDEVQRTPAATEGAVVPRSANAAQQSNGPEPRRPQARPARKLLLLLDIDHTLLNSAHTSKQPQCLLAADHYPGEFFEDPDLDIYVKLRPHLNEFLTAMKKLFTLGIVSMGDRRYIDSIVPFIDPDGIYFERKHIRAREDHLQCCCHVHESRVDVTSKCCPAYWGFPPEDIFVLDDRMDVWRKAMHTSNMKLGVLTVSEYVFFPSRDQDKTRLQPHDYDRLLPLMQQLLTNLHKQLQSYRDQSAHTVIEFNRRISMLKPGQGSTECLRIRYLDGGERRMVKFMHALGATEESQVTSCHLVLVHSKELLSEDDWAELDVARRHGIVIVSRHWFFDCHHLCELQDFRPYQVNKVKREKTLTPVYHPAQQAQLMKDKSGPAEIYEQLDRPRRIRLSQRVYGSGIGDSRPRGASPSPAREARRYQISPQRGITFSPPRGRR